MNRVESKNEIKVYEVRGEDTGNDDISISIVSHWNRREFIIIDTGNSAYTVDADDLRKAIENSQNV